MKYLVFAQPEQASYEICLLSASLHSADMRRIYVDPHFGNEPEKVLAYDLFKDGKTTKAALQREYLDDLLPVLEDLGVMYLVTCDAEYFKTLTRKPKAEGFLGYVLPSTCGRFHVVYCPNYRTVYLNPAKVMDDIRIALNAVKAHRTGAYIEPGSDIARFAAYPQTVEEIGAWLERLLAEGRHLAADIETFSLRHHEAGIGTIAFAWSRSEGIAFPVDLHPEAATIRAMLKEFFLAFDQKLLWHNISFDAYVLVYQLFMQDLLDTEGLLTGLEVMLKNWDCTKLITYLATNSCAGNKLGLKAQALEYTGDYAVEDITDIRLIPLDQLLRYNLVDVLATWFVYEKHWDTLIADQQLEIYETLFKPAVWDIIQMQLTGLPLDMEQVGRVKAAITEIDEDALLRLTGNPYVLMVEHILGEEWAVKRNAELKKKRVTGVDWPSSFNPNSGPQLQKLLFEVMELPVLDLTDSGLPATGGDTLEKLKNHTQDQDILSFLDALIDHKAVDKILGSFIPAFEQAAQGPDGWHYLFGSFNLGGTVSGRLSSSKPNLQNLPANVTMKPSPALLEKLDDVLGPYVSKGKLSIGKLVKSCFKAPPGWLFVGLDFASLEDRISALTTRDPRKLSVYLDGYDGHSLRAQAYFGDEMPDIDPTSVDSINSIADKYPAFRQQSKTPTFLLTYGGSWRGIVDQTGWSEEKAKTVESRYHELYQVSDQWVAARIQEASQCGYVTTAFGLRVRTPILHQSILGNRQTPKEAQAEGRTAGNALGQGWGLLNTRAWIEFMGKVRAHPAYRTKVRPCSQIHDAGYALIPDDLTLLHWMNQHLVEAVEWQDDPLIAHPEVKLGGELSVFFPSWAEELSLPNHASEEKIKELAMKHHAKYCGDRSP